MQVFRKPSVTHSPCFSKAKRVGGTCVQQKAQRGLGGENFEGTDAVCIPAQDV